MYRLFARFCLPALFLVSCATPINAASQYQALVASLNASLKNATPNLVHYCQPAGLLSPCVAALRQESISLTVFDVALSALPLTGKAALDRDKLITADQSLQAVLQAEIKAPTLASLLSQTSKLAVAAKTDRSAAATLRADLSLPPLPSPSPA